MSQTITLDVIQFQQPVGSFLLSVMKVPDLIRISRADPRKYDNISLESIGGIQREPSRKRIKEISEYARTVDAAFPTTILLSLDDNTYDLEDSQLKITGDKVADIVDGQHRILGLKEANITDEFLIPVVFILNATEEQKALVFATINGKQTKVPASIIYDLFGVTKTRSPQKTAHEIARALNSSSVSPWYKRLKMLGRKTPGSDESLSQGTFIKFLLPCISKSPDADRDKLKNNQEPDPQDDCVFNEYFRKNQDSIILKILINVFTAAKETWPKEWEDAVSYTLTKTNGFTGIMKALPKMVEHGKKEHVLSLEYFKRIFQIVRDEMISKNMEFTVSHFEPSSVGENRLCKLIIDAMERK
jgi:DGQHR domain-containing protein